MHILLYYIPAFIIINCCFYGIMREKYNKYNLERITDNLVEIDNSEVTSDSVRATCLADNTSNIFQLNDDNGIVSSIPLDNIVIEE